MKRKKPDYEPAKGETKRDRKPIELAHDRPVEQTGLLRGDHDDVGCADEPTDYDDPDVCYQIAMNNPRA